MKKEKILRINLIEIINKKLPRYFSESNLNLFEQTLSMFDPMHKKENYYFLYAPLKSKKDNKVFGYSVVIYDLKTKEIANFVICEKQLKEEKKTLNKKIVETFDRVLFNRKNINNQCAMKAE